MITYILIAINVLVSISAFSNKQLFDKLKYTPYLVRNNNEWHRLVSHAFLHANYTHLFVNMFVLYSFGTAVEFLFERHFDNWGVLLFLLLYVGGFLMAGFPALKKHGDNPYYHAVGASGAVASILFAFILMSPVSLLGLFLVIPIPAFVFGILYMWYETKMQNKNDGIAHDAHITGAIFGFTLPLVFYPKFILNFFDSIKLYIFSFF
jgi:membrane associated rhomboid family serine protease